MSAASRQRARDNGRGWNQEQREAYRERRTAKKIARQLKAAPKKEKTINPTVEAPLDVDYVPLL